MYRQPWLHCARYPHLLRIPLNRFLIGRRPRNVLRMDYLYVSKTGGHLLSIIDTFSRKTYLKHTMNEACLLKWHSHFVLTENFITITDHGLHFSNQVMQYAVHALRGKHEFSITFAPWTNCSCENWNWDILRILRQLCSELSLTDKDWPAWVATTA